MEWPARSVGDGCSLAFREPGAARSMPHVQDFHLVNACPVEDFVGIFPDDLDVNVLARRALRTQRIFRNLCDCIVNRIDDVVGAAWAALMNIQKNSFEV